MVKIFSILFIFFTLTSCYIDVPHMSQFDPENRFAKGNIKIKCYDKLNNPLSDVKIVLNDSLISHTNDSGYFVFYNVLKGAVNLKFEKEGYSKIQMDTFLKPGITLNIDQQLNFIPVMETSYVYSSIKRVNDIFDSLSYNVNYVLKVVEKDMMDDIDTVRINFNFGDFYIPIFYQDDYLKCSLNFNQNNSPIPIYDLIGQNGVAYLVDTYGEKVYSRDLMLIRFVENLPQIISPYEGEQLIFPYNFKFKVEKPSYSTFIEILILDQFEKIILCDSLSVEDTLFVYPLPLKEGEYKFVIRNIDLFGNFSENFVNFYSM